MLSYEDVKDLVFKELGSKRFVSRQELQSHRGVKPADLTKVLKEVAEHVKVSSSPVRAMHPQRMHSQRIPSALWVAAYPRQLLLHLP